MALHLGVVALAGPLAALGLARTGARGRPPGGWPLWALVASGIEMLVVWGWHAPALHQAAALSDAFFALQQGLFLVAGAAVWLPVVSGTGRAAAGAGALAMALSFMHMSMLGVLLATAPGPLYPSRLCGGAFGLDPLADQRAGGAIMAAFGGAPYLFGAAVSLHRLLSPGERPAQPPRRASSPRAGS
jgi:putative membrane protein